MCVPERTIERYCLELELVSFITLHRAKSGRSDFNDKLEGLKTRSIEELLDIVELEEIVLSSVMKSSLREYLNGTDEIRTDNRPLSEDR